MHKLAWSTFLCSLLVVAGCNNPSAPVSRSLVLLHTNDEHSHVFGAGPEFDEYPTPTTVGDGSVKGGVARRAVIFANERTAATTAKADTLTVSAGDNAMGTLSQVPFTTDAPDYVLMKKLGYDVTTLGNHEFDFGPAALALAFQAATAKGGAVPAVASNVQFSASDTGDDTLAALFDESGSDETKPIHRTLMRTTPNGLKVGFVGNLGAVAATYAPLKGPVTFSLPAGGDENDIDAVKAQAWVDLQKAVDKLRSDKADVVVILSHGGVNTADVTKGEDYDLAVHVNNVDVIVSGHTHTAFPAMTVVNPTTTKPVLIQQAGSYGQYVGRIQLTVDDKGKVAFDMAGSKLIPVDSTTIPSADFNPAIDDIVKHLEGTKLTSGKSFLEQTLSSIFGTAVTDDASKPGDLYFKKIAETDFNIDGLKAFTETPMLVLTADAELAGAQLYGNTDVAVMAAGVIRANLDKGKTGTVSFADVFRILPLGRSPVDGTIGYPLCRFAIYPIYLKAALELAAGFAYTSEDNSTNYLVPAGLRVTYDTSRPVFDQVNSPTDPNNGRVRKIEVAANPNKPDEGFTTIFDASTVGWDPGVPPLGGKYFVVATSYYIASFAKAKGITLFDPDTGTQARTPEESILKHPDGSEVKEWEVLAGYMQAQSTLNGGKLPSRYDRATGTFPRRMLCSGPLCVTP